MAKQRYCRVCGEPFMARRFDALTCTSTCWARKDGGDAKDVAGAGDCGLLAAPVCVAGVGGVLATAVVVGC